MAGSEGGEKKGFVSAEGETTVDKERDEFSEKKNVHHSS